MADYDPFIRPGLAYSGLRILSSCEAKLSRYGGLVGLLLSLATAPVIAAETSATDPQSLPFTLSWTSGICKACETARSLSKVQFVSPREAWGIGYNPPGETGAGDYTIVHTRDSGKTWTELADSYQHNGPPSISFSDQHQGWIKVFDMNEADDRIMQTRDGGRHWHRLPLRDLFIGDIEYLGNGVGHAYSFDPYKKQGDLLTTDDYGKHWQQSRLPAGFSADHLAFIDPSQGPLTGCLNRQVLAIKTIDAGKNWGQTRLDLPPSDPNKSTYCDFETDDLALLNDQRGWVLVNKHSFAIGDTTSFGEVLQTYDGGRNWVSTFQTTSSTEQIELTEVQFLTREIGFITKNDDFTGTQATKAATQSNLLYTIDGGKSWKEAKVDKPLWGCRPYSGDMVCAADGGGFSTVRISLISKH